MKLFGIDLALCIANCSNLKLFMPKDFPHT